MSLKQIEKRRAVFKPLLENPFPAVEFPFIEQELQGHILEFLLNQLQEVSLWNGIKGDDKPPKPEIVKELTIGFNSTVKCLEAQARPHKKHLEKKIRYVFVCKPDITPQLLIQQFPVLCYTASRGVKVKLIQLPRGSASQLGEKLARRCTILGMFDNDIIPTSFKTLLESTPDVQVPWLEEVKLRELNVKMLETSAPVKVQKKNKVEKKKK